MIIRYYIAVVHKDEDSAFGVHFPDIPGCFSAADTLDQVVPNAAEAIALYAEGTALPDPRSLEAIRKDKAVQADIAAGGILMAVPHIENDARVERVNITMEAGLLRAVDNAAKRIAKICRRPACVFAGSRQFENTRALT